jgi:hypothetical protein
MTADKRRESAVAENRATAIFHADSIAYEEMLLLTYGWRAKSSAVLTTFFTLSIDTAVQARTCTRPTYFSPSVGIPNIPGFLFDSAHW